MKILQAFDFLSLPHGGGTVDIVYRLSRALSARGHDVTICTGDYELDTEYLRGLSASGVSLKMYHSYFNKHGVYLMPGLLELDVQEYDLIHFQCYRSFQNIILSRKARKHHVPYIIDAHGSTVDRAGIKQLLILDDYDWMFGRPMINHSRFVIAETEVGVAEWEKLGASRDKIRLQHPLLDTSEFATLPDTVKTDPFIILFLGRIHRVKGIDILIEAFQKLVRSNDIRLVIAGQDDGYLETLTELVKEIRLQDKISFTGFIGGQDKLSALVNADVLVQPSRNEAGARPSLEAIMCHTPVVVSRDTGAGREIASFDGGLLFKSGDAEELASRIREIIDNPEAARARTEKAREYIEASLSLDKGIAGYEKLYQEATE